MQFVMRPGHGDDAIAHDSHEGYLEPLFNSEFARCFRDNTSFIDVGAHVGHWTVRAALLGVNVVAIEPQPLVREALQQNLQLNAVQRHVAVLPFAVWDSRTNLNLDIPTREEAQNQPPHIYGASPQACSGSVTVVNRKTALQVPALSLDAILFNHVPAVPGFVKIDVEGSEPYVVRGMEMTLRQYRPNLLIEMHDCYYGAEIATAVIELIEQADYRWQRIPAPGHWHMHAIPN